MLRPRAGGAGGAELGEERRRELLFGRRAGPQAAVANAETERLEEANHEAVDNLYGQVNSMRHLALNIGDEVSGQNAYLDGMNNTFDSAGERLSASLRALRALSSSGAGGHMCILFVFAFLFLLAIYLLLFP